MPGALLAALLAAILALAPGPGAAQSTRDPTGAETRDPAAGGGATRDPAGATGARDAGRDGGRDDASRAAREAGLGLREVARAPDGRVEYVAVGPPAAVGQAAAALQGAGASLLRDRPLSALGRRALVLVLPPGLSLAGARDLLAQAAPGVALDIHARYRFAEGAAPRLYAPDLVALPQGCRPAGRITVGIIDGPVAANHPAFAGVALRRDSVLLPGEVPPAADHGTAVAALVGGAEAAGPYAGFAAGVGLHAVSAFTVVQGREGADVDRIGAGLDLLLGRGVRVVNLSFAGPANTALADLLAAASGRGAVLVAASGNAGGEARLLPAAAPGVIAVTAVDARGRSWRKATGGGHLDFAAPGVEVFAAQAGGGAYVSGTSYAAPIVTAFAARLMARGAGSAGAVRESLAAGALDLGATGHDSRFGWGLARAPGC